MPITIIIRRRRTEILATNGITKKVYETVSIISNDKRCDGVCMPCQQCSSAASSRNKKKGRKKEKEKVSKGEEIEKREKRKQETNRMMSR